MYIHTYKHIITNKHQHKTRLITKNKHKSHKNKPGTKAHQNTYTSIYMYESSQSTKHAKPKQTYTKTNTKTNTKQPKHTT